MENENIKYIKFHCNPTVWSSLKFGWSISGGRSIGEREVTISKITYGKDKEKTTHSMCHRVHTNVSWFKIGGTNFWGTVQRGKRSELFEFIENSRKHLLEIARFIVIRQTQVGLKSGESISGVQSTWGRGCNFLIAGQIQKAPMGKDKKKTMRVEHGVWSTEQQERAYVNLRNFHTFERFIR